MPSETDRRGKLLPDPVEPPDTVCFTIQIPNAVQYRAAFLGQINVLGVWETWDHPTNGTDCVDCEQAAQLWRNAIYNATWSDDCGGDMSCEDVADCIENNAFVQGAIANQIETNELIKQAIFNAGGGSNFAGAPSVPGVGLTPSQMNANLAAADTCAFDPFWAQTEQFVDYLLNLGQDALEQLALYTETLNSGAAGVKMSGLISKLKNGATVGKVTEFLNWASNTMKGLYEAADNKENRDAIKCAIFCQNRDACLISLQGVWSVLSQRLGGALDPSSITTLEGLAETVVTLTFNPALALDVWMAFVIGTAKTAGLLGLEGIDETLQLILKVAVNDANNDWETLCEDCAARQYLDYIFTESEAGWNDNSFGSIWTVNEGWKWNIYGNFSINIPSVPFDVYRVDVEMSHFDEQEALVTSSPVYETQPGRYFLTGGVVRSIELDPQYKFPVGTRLGFTARASFANDLYIRRIRIWGP